MRIVRLVLTLLIFLPLPATVAAADTIDWSRLQGLGEVRYHAVHSERIDHDYHVFVRLPPAPTTDPLPTVYLLDGGNLFPMLAAYYGYLFNAGDAPPLVLVGISYGTDDWEQGNMRGRDYTGPAASREFYGGAPRFQSFLRDELFPLIEATYPSDPEQRMLFGQSLGGQFAIHTALFAPGLFHGHIASNPAMHRNLAMFIDAETVVRSESAARLFVSIGSEDEERFREPAQQWVDFWTDRSDRPFALEVRHFDGENHFSPAPLAFRQGIRWLFGR